MFRLIQGVIALFSSGILFRPMVLCGAILSFILIKTFSLTEIGNLVKSFNFYALMFLIAALSTCIFRCDYYKGGTRINWNSTLKKILAEFIMLIFTTGFSFIFWAMLPFGPEFKRNETTIIKVQSQQSYNHRQKLQNPYYTKTTKEN